MISSDLASLTFTWTFFLIDGLQLASDQGPEFASFKGQSRVKISAMSVSRLLMALTGKDLLMKAGNGYEPMDPARTRPQQRTL